MLEIIMAMYSPKANDLPLGLEVLQNQAQKTVFLPQMAKGNRNKFGQMEKIFCENKSLESKEER